MNDDLKLDPSFKQSFIMDIIKGMDYLHKSHLHSHGNLKSSNCLVDARWTVKVTAPSLLSSLNFLSLFV
jgi:serine/threonine protein kinase